MRFKFVQILIGAFLLFSKEMRANMPERLAYNASAFWSRVYPGGNFGLSFGRNTLVEISPLLGFWVTEKFTTGLSLSYLYFRGNIQGVLLQNHVFGVSPFARYFFSNWLFAHTEMGVYNGLRIRSDMPLTTTRAFAIFPLVGGGTNIGFGSRSGCMLMILYNLNFDPNFLLFNNSPLIIRVGFYF